MPIKKKSYNKYSLCLSSNSHIDFVSIPFNKLVNKCPQHATQQFCKLIKITLAFWYFKACSDQRRTMTSLPNCLPQIIAGSQLCYGIMSLSDSEQAKKSLWLIDTPALLGVDGSRNAKLIQTKIWHNHFCETTNRTMIKWLFCQQEKILIYHQPTINLPSTYRMRIWPINSNFYNSYLHIHKNFHLTHLATSTLV